MKEKGDKNKVMRKENVMNVNKEVKEENKGRKMDRRKEKWEGRIGYGFPSLNC